MGETTYSVGDRVWEHERIGGLCKIVAIASGKYGVEYQVRQFGHPHRMFWTDEEHLSRPVGMTHDERKINAARRG